MTEEPATPTRTPPAVAGAHDLTMWFGAWPSFHDAEILELHLSRVGESYLHLHTWAAGDVNPATGQFRRERECVVRLAMRGITDLDLNDFTVQNVVGGLWIDREASGWKLQLVSCFGLAGLIWCRDLAFSLTPGAPPPPSGDVSIGERDA